ncbi:hypothetical protein [Mangrovimonas sp. YM274]|uniref:hypothetical protein n=1 Tax=Mangrovimonas sp. YM274 TaxID=3070660 RepID=UPI0027DC4E96|nr:hypothetical protein [Mangrovimonas sp. YM274]WMI70072.1 hypothetical protein RBH95_06910 [Mangrovimonas sp. YM274]
MKINKQLVGVAGEYFVAAELSRRGYLAAITLRNSDGVDILTSNIDGSKSFAIQVKTTQDKKKWVLNKKIEDEVTKDKYFVFVTLYSDPSKYPDYIIIKGSDLGKFIKEGHQNWLKNPGKKGQQRKDTSIREFNPSYIDQSKLMSWDGFVDLIEG